MSKIVALDKVYGQTINIRYYVERKVKPKPYFWKGKHLDGYPLYVQINVRRQTSLRKSSAFDNYIAPEALDDFLQDNAQTIAVESEILRKWILLHKPFDDANFSLSRTLSGFNALQEDVSYLIGELLREDYQKARLADSEALMKSDLLYSLPELHFGLYAGDEDEQSNQLEEQAIDLFYRGKVDEAIHPVAVLSEVRDLAIPGKPHVKALYDKYGKHFWGIDRYCRVIREQTQFKLITLQTFMSDKFRRSFIQYLPEETYQSINQGVSKLSDEKPVLKKLLSGSLL